MSEAEAVTLRPRAREVARLVALGLTNRQIAHHLFLSERTVEWHVDQILNRLGFSSRSQVAAWVGRSEPAVAVRRPGPRFRANLPAQLTRFIGRERDLTALRRLVTKSRLVTISGPGGMGKTRLALTIAAELEPSTADGAWLCELAQTQDVDAAIDSIAETLGVERASGDLLGALGNRLRDQDAVLVLDTCEHLLPALSPIIEDLLKTSPRLRLIATSRSPLDITGEALWRLGPLVPADAVQLFTERAAAAAPDFDADAVPRGIEDLCDRLGGVPLALELAAAKLRVQNLDEISAAVLVTGDRRLAAVADWSYRLLQPGAQTVFQRVSIFARWFDVDDATAVAADVGSVKSLLAQLVESSMLIRESLDGARERFRILEVLKPFALRILADSGDDAQTRMAHAERMIDLAELLDLRRDEAPPDTWRKVAAMIDDVRFAMDTLLSTHPTKAARLAAALMHMWLDTGRLDEGRRWTESALEAASEPSAERCSLLYAHALLLYWLGRPEQADRSFCDALALTEMPGCEAIRGELLVRAALAYSYRGEWALAEAAQRRAIDIFSASGQEQNAARPLNHLAISLLFQRRLEEASALAERSVELRRRRRARVWPALDTAAQARALLGDLDGARRRWLEAATITLADGDQVDTSCSLEGLAYVAAQEGRKENAIRLHYCAHRSMVLAGEHYGEPLAPELSRAVKQIQSGLDRHTLEQLRAEGLAMSLDSAVRLAAG